jgi:serine/threonine protein kinase
LIAHQFQTNILVNDEGEASITDFGLSRVLDTPGFTTAASGTLRYMPPELAKIYEEESMTQVTEATDVWEFSMTALEVRICFSISLSLSSSQVEKK